MTSTPPPGHPGATSPPAQILPVPPSRPAPVPSRLPPTRPQLPEGGSASPLSPPSPPLPPRPAALTPSPAAASPLSPSPSPALAGLKFPQRAAPAAPAARADAPLSSPSGPPSEPPSEPPQPSSSEVTLGPDDDDTPLPDLPAAQAPTPLPILISAPPSPAQLPNSCGAAAGGLVDPGSPHSPGSLSPSSRSPGHSRLSSDSDPSLSGLEKGHFDLLRCNPQFLERVAAFNQPDGSTKKAIAALIADQFVGPAAHDVALFLQQCADLDKKQLGDYIGERDDFAIQVLKAFVKLLDLTGLDIDTALDR